jgi:hypothetical protein
MLYSSSTTQEDKTEIRKVIDSWLLFNTKNIDCCLTQMWTIIQLYRDKNKLYSSEWLLFNANSSIWQLFHGENKLIVNEIMMRCALL